MARLTVEQLADQITDVIRDLPAGNISAADARLVFTNIIESFYNIVDPTYTSDLINQGSTNLFANEASVFTLMETILRVAGGLQIDPDSQTNRITLTGGGSGSGVIPAPTGPTTVPVEFDWDQDAVYDYDSATTSVMREIRNSLSGRLDVTVVNDRWSFFNSFNNGRPQLVFGRNGQTSRSVNVVWGAFPSERTQTIDRADIDTFQLPSHIPGTDILEVISLSSDGTSQEIGEWSIADIRAAITANAVDPANPDTEVSPGLVARTGGDDVAQIYAGGAGTHITTSDTGRDGGRVYTAFFRQELQDDGFVVVVPGSGIPANDYIQIRNKRTVTIAGEPTLSAMQLLGNEIPATGDKVYNLQLQDAGRILVDLQFTAGDIRSLTSASAGVAALSLVENVSALKKGFFEVGGGSNRLVIARNNRNETIIGVDSWSRNTFTSPRFVFRELVGDVHVPTIVADTMAMALTRENLYAPILALLAASGVVEITGNGTDTITIGATGTGDGGGGVDRDALLALLTAGTDIGIRQDPNDATKVEIRYTGTGGGTAYNRPAISGFLMEGLDIDDGDIAGDVTIRGALVHPENIRGNTPGGAANNAIGIEVSADGQTYTSITTTIRQTITKDGFQQGVTITLPSRAVAVNASVYFRAFAYTNQTQPEKIVSNALRYRRAQQQEYLYGFGAASRNDLVYANYDITAYDQRWDVSNAAYDVDLELAGVPSGDYVMVLVPGNREPTEIRDALNIRLTVGTDIQRVANARTIGGQAYTAYYIHHTDSLPGDYELRFIRS